MGVASGATLPGGNARLCQGSGCDQNKHVPIFGDVDGDGNMDFQALSFSGSTVGTAFSRSAQAFQPRDLITSITNGLGATTQLQYAPLTNTAIYRRSTGSRNGLNWGRGSPVVDLLAPTYVVAKASSSAPRAGNPGAMASLYYRYANARVQAGGRGFLGFGSIETIDVPYLASLSRDAWPALEHLAEEDPSMANEVDEQLGLSLACHDRDGGWAVRSLPSLAAGE